MEEPDDYLGAEFDDAAAMGEGGEDAEDDVPLPVSKWKPPVIIPKEINEGSCLKLGLGLKPFCSITASF